GSFLERLDQGSTQPFWRRLDPKRSRGITHCPCALTPNGGRPGVNGSKTGPLNKPAFSCGVGKARDCGTPSRSLKPSYAPNQKVRSFASGPPNAAPNWLRLR